MTHWLPALILLSSGALLFFAWRSLKQAKEIHSKQCQLLEVQAAPLKEAHAKTSEELKTIRSTLRQLQHSQSEIPLIQSILSSLPFRFPVFFGRWSIDGHLAREIVDILEQRRPRTILELGSGTSTILIAAVLERLGQYGTRHLVVDHDPEFLECTRRNLELQKFGHTPEFWNCPLEETSPDGPLWYRGVCERLEGVEIDFVIVDGPPGSLHPESRRPALHKLRPFLSKHAILILDDASREQEKETVQAWRLAFPELHFHMSNRGKGYACFSMEKIRIKPQEREAAPSR